MDWFGRRIAALAGVLVIILLSAVPGFSQENDMQPRTAVVLTVVDLSEPPQSDPYRRIITETLTAETRNAGFTLVSADDWQLEQSARNIAGEDLILGPPALEIGQAVAADVVATGSYRVDQTEQRILIQVKFYDVVQNRLLGSVFRTGRLGLAVYNTINSAVLDVISQLEKPLPPLAEVEVKRDPMIRDLVLLSDQEAAEILLDGQVLGQISDGELIVPSVTSPSLALEQRKDGFHSVREVVSFPPGGDETELSSMLESSRWGSEFLWTTGQMLGMGLGLRYYAVPDSLWLSVDDYYYVQHTLKDSSSAVHHSDTRVLVGRYLLSRPESRWRYGLSAGIGGILTWFTVPDQPVYYDFYINPLNVFAEHNRDLWAWFFRVEGRYVLGVEKGLLDRGWLSVGDGPPPFTFGAMRKW